jgi:hypothetical protein
MRNHVSVRKGVTYAKNKPLYPLISPENLMLLLFKLCKYFRLTGESRKDIETINGITQLWRYMLTSEI